MNVQTKNLFVVECSVDGNSVRVSVGTVFSMLRRNLRVIARKQRGAFAPVAILATQAQAEFVALQLQQHFEQEFMTSLDPVRIFENMDKLLSQLLSQLDSDPQAIEKTKDQFLIDLESHSQD